MDTINALTAITTVGSATSDTGRQQQFQQLAKPGQTFTATVLESAGSNRFYLDVLGDKILAQCDTVNLTSGTTLTLEVLSTRPLLELRIISKNPERFFGKTLILLGKNLDISSLFESLVTPPPSSIVEQPSAPTQESPGDVKTVQQRPIANEGGSELLKQLLDRLKLSLETLLTADDKNLASQSLKAELLNISTLMKQGGELADSTNRLFGTLELYKLNKLRLASENLLIYSLPHPFSGNGYLLLDNEHNASAEETGSEALVFSLHLTLEPLGDIEINILQTVDGSQIRFGFETQTKKEFVIGYQEILKEMVGPTNILGLSFLDTAGNPAKDLIQHLVPDGEPMLDTKI